MVRDNTFKKKKKKTKSQWLTPVISATWEAVIRRTTVLGQPGQKSLWHPHLNVKKKAGPSGTHLSSLLWWEVLNIAVQAGLNKITLGKRAEDVACMSEALSSNPSPITKNKNRTRQKVCS
jgi:hypothetical protein